jgi:hypothetical protein
LEWREYQSRRATPGEIAAWWDRWPNANLGVVTGCVSGLVVLDLDGPEAVAYAKRHGVPLTPTVATGKGWHIYFQYPGQPVQNAASLDGVKGLDVRANGGYVVAPPSIHPSGRQYRWAPGRSPNDLPLAPCPAWLLDLLAKRNRAQAASPTEPGWVEALLRGVPEGQRDDACTRLAGHFLGKGLPESEVLAILVAWNQRNRPPLSEKDVEKCVRSVANREARKLPRPVPVKFHLDGPVYTPENWRTLVICRSWQEARKLAVKGNAVAVCRRDGSLPPEAGKLVAMAQDVKTAGFTQEEARRLAWELYPLRLVRAGATTDGTAALRLEPETAPSSTPSPGLSDNHADEAVLAQAVAAGREAMREALAVRGEPAPEPPELGGFALTERLFGGFDRVWDLTPAQAARLEAIFQEKGPVAVRTVKNWYSANEWAERLG